MGIDKMEERKEILIEYWKSYSEQANELTSKRQTTNSIYLTLQIALLGFSVTYMHIVGIIISSIGLVINLVWLLTVISLRKLNSTKFELINKMEDEIGLDIRPYKEEWNVISNQKYIKLTFLELMLIIILALMFIASLIISIISYF